MTTSSANTLRTNGPVLMVEGQDDKHMVWQLCRRDASSFSVTRSGDNFFVTLLPQSKTFRISEQGSKPDLIKAIRQQVVAANLQPVGILVDTDEELGKCWGEIVTGFERTGVQLPPSPNTAGIIIPQQDFSPRIGIWLMPDNKSQGEMEDFVKGLIPYNDAVWSLSEHYIENILLSDRKFVPEKIDKAKVYAWLATRKDPGRVGAAIGAYDLEVKGPLCRDFLNWLTNLFG